MRQGRGLDSALAAVATMTAAWPISTLLAQPTWLRGTVLLLAVIALSGVGARWLALRDWQVLAVQLACSVLAASTIYGQGHLWHALPSFQTLGLADRLVHEAFTTAQRYAAPAPTTPGLIFVVGCSLGLAALAVDYLAVTRRSPSLAGLPLLSVFLASVANRGSTMPVIFFLAAATMWLILVARAGGSHLRRWPTTVAVAHTPVPQNLQSPGVHEHASAGRMLGAVALVTAVSVPVVLPHAPPTFLQSGLGRTSSSTGNAPRLMGFSQSLDLAADLKSSNRAPVLQYTTTDTSPPPLRVAVGSYYREPGVWLPWGRRSGSGKTDLWPNPVVPEPVGLSPGVPKRAFVMDFRRNLLQSPNLAVPYPLIGANLAGVEWGTDEETQSVTVAARPVAYAASYWHLVPTPAMLRRAPSLSERNRSLFELDLSLDGRYVGRVTDLAERLTSGKTTDYDKAMAIQQYLRADGGFTYSLTLAPPAKDRSGNSAGFDSLTNFLVTKRGYCVQFATAMVMMSRAAGIPARTAIGFIPGTQAKGVWTVVAADAHAWPELYLDGIGWTRFEPTPSRATPPAYATPQISSGTSVDETSPDTASAAPRANTAPKDLGGPSTEDGAAQDVSLTPASVLRWLTHGWGPVLLGALTGLLGSLVVPTAARWRRRRSLANALSAAQRVEVQWELLTSSLGDLGITPAPSRTPRQLNTYYGREASLEGAASQALGRIVQTVERSRYAPSPGPPNGLAADTREVFRAAAQTRRGRDRLRAAMWPSSGITQLRATRANLRRRIRSPFREVSKLTHRR